MHGSKSLGRKGYKKGAYPEGRHRKINFCFRLTELRVTAQLFNVAIIHHTSRDVLHGAMSNYTSGDVFVRGNEQLYVARCFARGNEQLYVELQKLDCVFADELAVVLLADSSVFDHFV